MSYADKSGGQAIILPDDRNFNRLVDEACDRLRLKKAELSIRHIRLLEEQLNGMERELDDFIARKALVQEPHG
ncbi:MAG: hypothetical protein LBT16_11240 [Treponema sp.]|jgi:hypothetical protein|nr:hypothetical protein [Treponema sp.]